MALHCALLACALAGIAVSVPVSAKPQSLSYPRTRKVNQVDDYHGTKVADPYRWLEDANSKETADWVKEENEVTQAYLDKIPFRDRIRARLTSLANYAKYTQPYKEGDYYFFQKNDGLQNQSVLYVQKSLKGDPRALLDPNTLSKDGTIALSGYSPSHNGKLLAYYLSDGGSDWHDILLRDVETGNDLSDRLTNIKFSGASWTLDNKGFFYSRFPKQDAKKKLQAENRDQKIYYHVIGTDQSADQLIYERPDIPEWGLSAYVTEDGRYAMINLRHGTDPKNKLYYIDLKDPHSPELHGTVTKLLDDFDASYQLIQNDGSTFYFKTDQAASRGRVISIDLSNPARENWKTIIPESPDTLQGISLVGDQFLATYLHDASSEVRIFDTSGKFVKKLALPTIGSVSGLGGKRRETELFYTFTSFLYPPTIYRYDLKAGKSTVFRKPEVNFDAAQYETKQVFYSSNDGTRIPMFLVHKKDIALDGSHPTLLYGYGGFNVSETPVYATSRIVWLENGGVYAHVCLRGGGEYGEEWHKSGTLERKQNVFDDFIAGAEHLISNGYTSSKKLAIQGGSNGGLLVGAVLNQRPDLFGVALPAVGVMDMLRYDKFTIGRYWRSDYGTSEKPDQFKFLYPYSPLHNIKPGVKYPATFVTTGDHDDRVVPAHSFKYAATLQSAQGGDAPILIRIETRAGHGAGKPLAMQIEEVADEFAFTMSNLGMKFTRHVGVPEIK